MKKLLMLPAVLALLFAGVSAQDAFHSLENTEWRFIADARMGTTAPTVEDRPITLKFTSETDFSGYSGCNFYHGTYDQDLNAVRFSETATTRMACLDEQAAEQENGYLQTLSDVLAYQWHGDMLTLLTTDGKALHFVAHGQYALRDSTWELISYGAEGAETAALEGATPTLTFIGADSNLSLHGGCNGFGASYEMDGDTLSISGGAGTLMACDPEIMTQETAYIALVTDAVRYEHRGGSLLIYTSDDQVLRFAATGAYALTVATWELESFVTGEAVDPALETAPVMLVFQTDGTASGSSGCNHYSSSYTVEEDRLTFSPVVTTQMACMDDAAMAQEMRYQNALQVVERFTVSADTLTLHTADGELRFSAANP